MAHMRSASTLPRSPVAALALPLLSTTAAARPPVAAKWARETCTGAAVARFDVNPVVVRPAVSGKPSMRLAHCTAWPDAPFTRLSRAPSAITHPVRSSYRAVRWAALEPSVALVDGDASLTHTNGLSA